MTPASQPQPAPTRERASAPVLPDVIHDAELLGSDQLSAAVRADLIERADAGVKKYGTPLMTHNGRDALWDFYQEMLDAIMYARQEEMETPDLDSWALYEDAVRLAKRVRARIDARGTP